MRVLTALFVSAAVPLLLLGCGQDEPADVPTGPDPRVPEVVHQGRPLADWAQDLESDVEKTRNVAVYQLEQLGPQAAGAVPALTRALTHDDFYMQVASARALAAIGPVAVPVLEQVIADGRLHDDALESLSALGTAGAPLVAAIFERAVSAHAAGHEKTWWSAGNALAEIGDAGFRYAAEQSRSDRRAARLVAVYVLASARTAAARAVARPALEALGADPDAEVRSEAGNALSGLRDD